jgi:hypothetical protein
MGRWHRIERHNRHCNVCQYQELGDEFHYILQCRSLVDIRKQFLNPYFIHKINILKFGKLFQSKQKRKLKNLCKFIRFIRVIRIINSQVVLPG